MEVCVCAPGCASARTRWRAALTQRRCRGRTPGRSEPPWGCAAAAGPRARTPTCGSHRSFSRLHIFSRASSSFSLFSHPAGEAQPSPAARSGRTWFWPLRALAVSPGGAHRPRSAASCRAEKRCPAEPRQPRRAGQGDAAGKRALPWGGLAQHRAQRVSPAWVGKTSGLQNEWEREKPLGASKQRNKRNRSMAVGSSASRPCPPLPLSPPPTPCRRCQDAPWRSRSWPRCPCRSSGTAWSRSGTGRGRAGGSGLRTRGRKGRRGEGMRGAGAWAMSGAGQGLGLGQDKNREGQRQGEGQRRTGAEIRRG